MLFWGPNLRYGTGTANLQFSRNPKLVLAQNCMDAYGLTLCGTNTFQQVFVTTLWQRWDQRWACHTKPVPCLQGSWLQAVVCAPQRITRMTVTYVRCDVPIAWFLGTKWHFLAVDFALLVMWRPWMVFGVAALLHLGVPGAWCLWRGASKPMRRGL